MLNKKIINSYLMLVLTIAVLFVLVFTFHKSKAIYLLYLELIFTVLFFTFVFFAKRIKLQDEKTRIIRELPFFLNSLASDVEKGIPLKLSLENCAKKSTMLGKKINNALELAQKRGYTLESALEKIAKGNKELERVMYQVVDILQSGTRNKADTFRILSANFTEQQSMAIKSYSAKLNFLSLIFVVVSAIVPALFLMFFLVGSNFLEITISNIGVVLITLVLFPMIDMFILLFMRANLV